MIWNWLIGFGIYLVGAVIAFCVVYYNNWEVWNRDKDIAISAAIFSWVFIFINIIGEMGS